MIQVRQDTRHTERVSTNNMPRFAILFFVFRFFIRDVRLFLQKNEHRWNTLFDRTTPPLIMKSPVAPFVKGGKEIDFSLRSK